MLSTSTIQILKSLNLQELKRFGDFIKSPYHNTTTALEKIYEAAFKARPNFDSEALQYENMSKVIFDSGEYKEKRIKNLYSEFGNLLKKFLGNEEIHNYKDYEFDIALAEALTRKNLFEVSEKIIKKSIERRDKGLITDDLTDFYKYRILNTSLTNNSELSNFKLLDGITFEMFESLTAIFIRNAYTLNEGKSITEIPGKNEISFLDIIIESFDMDKVLEYLRKSNHRYYSYFKIHYQLYFYLTNVLNEEKFYELKNEVMNIAHKIQKEEAYTIIVRLNNLIFFKLYPLDRKFGRDAFELGKLFCELNVFPNNYFQFILIGVFRDLFNNAINLKEYGWVENYVNEYSQYLSEEYKKNEINYCKGVLNFYKRKFEESLNFFSQVKPIGTLYNIQIRFYYLLNYIELKAYENARSSLQTIKQFHRDKEISEIFNNKATQDSLKYLNEIIICEEQGKKIDEIIYKEANDGRMFKYALYIKEKMEKLK